MENKSRLRKIIETLKLKKSEGTTTTETSSEGAFTPTTSTDPTESDSTSNVAKHIRQIELPSSEMAAPASDSSKTKKFKLKYSKPKIESEDTEDNFTPGLEPKMVTADY